MTSFSFSTRSEEKLEGVDPMLVDVMRRALELSPVDFGIISGVRTEDEQAALVASGASQTMKSKHLVGAAVDILAYIGPRGSWELPLYTKIAEAVREAAIEQRVGVRWGGAWTTRDIRRWMTGLQAAQRNYIDHQRFHNKDVFIDAGHFELSRVNGRRFKCK